MLQRCICRILLLWCLPFPGFSQTTFTPLADNPVTEQALLEEIAKRNKEEIARLDGKYKKYLAVIYQERYQLIKERIADKEVLTSREANGYLQAVAQEIFKANPSLNSKELRILFSKSHYANAASMGEGTIFFNIGLFHRMENEAQVAFALCHELAHYYLDHSNTNIVQYVNTIYSDEFQRQLKNIQQSEYRKNQQLEKLAKSLLFRTRRHSRQYEQAADSLALHLLKNTAYDLNSAVSTLALLDSADKDKYNHPLQLEQRFNFPGYAFKNNWLQSTGFSFASDPEETDNEADSLKTHPDCKKRLADLLPAVQQYRKSGGHLFLVNEGEFKRLKAQFDYEIIEHYFQTHRVSLALYLSLQMLGEKPADPYLQTMVGRCLNEIYERQKAHELGKIVDMADNRYNREYNNLLRLIQNLRLTEVAALAYYYLEALQPRLGHHKDFVAAWVTSKNNFSK